MDEDEYNNHPEKPSVEAFVAAAAKQDELF